MIVQMQTMFQQCAGGGAPIAGNGKVMLNDLLGTTMATSRGGASAITAFGETSDPLGHPDGWNNYAYCSNKLTIMIDWLGDSVVLVINSSASGEASGTNASGHSWIAYTDDATGKTTTYGTWGNKRPNGLRENLEAQYEAMGAYGDKATRSSHLTNEQEAALMAKIQE